MGLDLRLQQKMVQQLVMTPQLQQAIKLLQLSHLEMAEVLREEVEQNPVLEEKSDNDDEHTGEGDLSHDDPTGDAPSTDGVSQADLDLASDLPSVLDAPVDATPEPTNQEVEREIDWESYLDSYSYALPTSQGGGAGDDLPGYEATLSTPSGLAEHLRWQVHMAAFTSAHKAIAMLLVEELSEDGYLPADAVQTVAQQAEAGIDDVETVLCELKNFDPVGVFSRDLRECLLTQLHQLSHVEPLAIAIVEQHLLAVQQRSYQSIAKTLQVSLEEVGAAVKLIGQLQPRPGYKYNAREAQYIVPDIFVHKVGDDYVIVLNEDGLPRLRISSYYRDALRSSGGQTKSYIQERLRSAAWLIRSIHMRQRTIYRVVESILKFQRPFFDQGVAYLKPLILKDVAEDLELHESTISRVTTNKYVHTPQGIYEFKYFFNSSINRMGGESIASESVRSHIQRLIGEEDPRAPFSDQKLVELLKQYDIDIARRTVAKYREMLRIPASSRRKRVF